MRDVLRGSDWSPDAFEDYAAERQERMRRLRFIANTVAITEAEDADNREARRARWGELMETDERAFLVLASAFGGPEIAPPEAFADELHAAVARGLRSQSGFSRRDASAPAGATARPHPEAHGPDERAEVGEEEAHVVPGRRTG